jgi:hypothetical protein
MALILTLKQRRVRVVGNGIIYLLLSVFTLYFVLLTPVLFGMGLGSPQFEKKTFSILKLMSVGQEL